MCYLEHNTILSQQIHPRWGHVVSFKSTWIIVSSFVFVIVKLLHKYYECSIQPSENIWHIICTYKRPDTDFHILSRSIYWGKHTYNFCNHRSMFHRSNKDCSNIRCILRYLLTNSAINRITFHHSENFMEKQLRQFTYNSFIWNLINSFSQFRNAGYLI